MRKAFTLAEIITTLGIIGVVAALTLPNLIKAHQQRTYQTGHEVFQSRLWQWLSHICVLKA